MHALQPGEAFQVGEVWTSPRGTYYKVVERSGRVVTLRAGVDGSGCKIKRDWDAVAGWALAPQPAADEGAT